MNLTWTVQAGAWHPSCVIIINDYCIYLEPGMTGKMPQRPDILKRKRDQQVGTCAWGIPSRKQEIDLGNPKVNYM